MALSYLIFYKYLLHFELLGQQVFMSIPGTILVRNRKIVQKHRSHLLIFSPELEISGVALYREYMKTAKNVSFCEK